MMAMTTLASSSGSGVIWNISPLVMWAIDIGIVMLVIGLLCCVWRLMRGPHLADRSIAVDTIGVLLVGLVGLFTVRLQTLAFLDAVLVLSLLSFAGTVALAQYIARPFIRDSRPKHTDTHDEGYVESQPQGE